MKPYYSHGGIEIYCGDAREILPQLADQKIEACITDPIWPNHSSSLLVGSDRPYELFSEVVRLLNVERLVVHLGVHSDPRFLNSVPNSLPFFRVCWLEHIPGSYRGQVLVDAEIAYVFGVPPKPRPGAMVIPGRCLSTSGEYTRGTGRHKDRPMLSMPHPCPRHLKHVSWLVRWFAGDGPVIDPFMGSGTTLVACKDQMIPAIGIEIEQQYCDLAIERLAQEALPFEEAFQIGQIDFE